MIWNVVPIINYRTYMSGCESKWIILLAVNGIRLAPRHLYTKRSTSLWSSTTKIGIFWNGRRWWLVLFLPLLLHSTAIFFRVSLSLPLTVRPPSIFFVCAAYASMLFAFFYISLPVSFARTMNPTWNQCRKKRRKRKERNNNFFDYYACSVVGLLAIFKYK